MRLNQILITGAAGFLGCNLAEHLIKNNIEVIALELSSANLKRLEQFSSTGKLKIIFADNSEIDDIFKDNKISAVVHCAVNYGRAEYDNAAVIDSNIRLPIELLETAIKYDADIFLNSDSFFNAQNSNYQYMRNYTLSKKQCVEWLMLSGSGKIPVINLKLFHLFGRYDNINKFAPQIISQLLNNEKNLDLTLCENERDFIYVEDAAAAFAKIIEKRESFNKQFYEFEIGSGKPVKVKTFVSRAKELIKSTTELNFGALAYRENEIMHSRANLDPILQLGWSPIHSLDEGLIKTIEYIKNTKFNNYE